MRKLLIIAFLTAAFLGTALAQELKDIERAYLKVVRKVKPACVYLQVIRESSVKDKFGSTDTIISATNFSGIVVTRDGHVATIARGVKDAKKIYAVSVEGRRCEAELVGVDEKADIGIIRIKKIEGWDAVPVEFGDSDKLEAGCLAVIVGSPCGLKHTVVYGNVSGLNRTLVSENTFYTEMIQIACPLSQADPGGLIADSEGKLIGMVSPAFIKTAAFKRVEMLIDSLNRQISSLMDQLAALKRKTPGNQRQPSTPKRDRITRASAAGELYDPALSQGINFAIPVNAIKIVCDRIIRGKKQPYVGVSVRELVAPEKNQLKLESGLFVLQVVPNSPAAKSGLKRNDIILASGDRKISSVQIFRDVISSHAVGQEMKLTVFRKQEKVDVTLKLEERP